MKVRYGVRLQLILVHFFLSVCVCNVFAERIFLLVVVLVIYYYWALIKYQNKRKTGTDR